MEILKLECYCHLSMHTDLGVAVGVGITGVVKVCGGFMSRTNTQLRNRIQVLVATVRWIVRFDVMVQ